MIIPGLWNLSDVLGALFLSFIDSPELPLTATIHKKHDLFKLPSVLETQFIKL